MSRNLQLGLVTVLFLAFSTVWVGGFASLGVFDAGSGAVAEARNIADESKAKGGTSDEDDLELPPHLEGFERLEASPERGRKLFEGRLSCSGCHARDAREGSYAPNLAGAGDRLSRRHLVTSVVYPSRDIAAGYDAGDMPTDFAEQLTAQDLADLTAYLQTL